MSPTAAGGAARSYAQAAFDVAREHHDVRGWLEALERLDAVFGDAEVAAAFANPRLDDGQRVGLALALVGQELNAQQANFVKLLVLARRTDAVADIGAEFQRLVDEAEGRVELEVTLPAAPGAEEERRLNAELSGKVGREVKVNVKVDPEILGGLVIRHGDHVVDGSVRRRLAEMREELLAG